MSRRIGTVYSVELSKALRRKYTYVGPALVAAAVAGSLVIRPVARDGMADYAFIANATLGALSLVGVLAILVHGAALVAAEPYGALRHTLTRPIARYEFILAKLLLGMTYAAMLTLLAGALAWGFVFLLGDRNGVLSGSELIFSEGEMTAAYVLGALLALAPQWATVAYALFWSTCTRNPLAAVLLAVGGWVAVDLLKYPLGIDAYLFTTYVERCWEVFALRADGLTAAWFPMAWQCLLASAAGGFLFTAAAIVRFRRRDLA